MSYDPNLPQSKSEVQTHAALTPKDHWLDLKFGLFIHFGINTFNDVEWSDGTLSPSTYNPMKFDANQWCEAAKSAGVGYLMLVTKHHDGFCNWPSRWTRDYSVEASPFKRDVVGEVAAACKNAGIKLAFYYSLWDRHAPMYDDDRAYALYMKRHLTELLTQYGEVVELWFDGGWKKTTVHCQDVERWHWREIYEHIKSIQPDCLVGNNGTTDRPGEIITYPCDLLFGEKTIPNEGDKDKKWWLDPLYAYGLNDTKLPFESQFTLSKGGGKKDAMFGDGKWFWHADDDTVQDAKWVVDTLNLCNERGANFVINAGPSNEGLLRELDVKCLREVGKLRGIS